MEKRIEKGWWTRICKQAEKEREKRIAERFRDINLGHFIDLIKEEITKNFPESGSEEYRVIASTRSPGCHWFDELELHRIRDNYSERYFLKVRHHAEHSDDYSYIFPRLYWTSEIRDDLELNIFKPDYGTLSFFFEKRPFALVEAIIKKLS